MTTSLITSITDELLENAARDFEDVGNLHTARISCQEVADALRELIRLRAENTELRKDAAMPGEPE